MAAPSVTVFLERYPEFTGQSETVIEQCLLEADLVTPVAEWGALTHSAVLALAGHKLATRQKQVGEQVGTTTGNMSQVQVSPTSQYTTTIYGLNYLSFMQTLPVVGFAF